MSAIFNSIFGNVRDESEPAREIRHCDLLSAEQMAAVDETAGLITLDPLPLGDSRRAHMDQLAALREGSLRGLPSCFGALE
jgi:hypothetical protein